MRYDTVIYDLDGTLLNTLDDLAAAVNHAMRVGGFHQHSVQAVCAMVGDGMEMLIRRALPADADEATLAKTLADFKAYYALHSDDLTSAYEDIPQLLDALQQMGVKQAVVSNKGDPFVKALCRRYFGRYITDAIGEQPGVRRKPAPDSVLRVMADLNCDPARTLYVGDSDVDIQTAQNAGVDCASVCWGFRTEEQLKHAGAAMLVHEPLELVEIVKGMKE